MMSQKKSDRIPVGVAKSLPCIYAGIAALVVMAYQACQAFLPPVYPSAEALNGLGVIQHEMLAVRRVLVEPGMFAWLGAAVVCFLCACLMFRGKEVAKTRIWQASVIFLTVQLILQPVLRMLGYMLLPRVHIDMGGPPFIQGAYLVEQCMIAWLGCVLTRCLCARDRTTGQEATADKASFLSTTRGKVMVGGGVAMLLVLTGLAAAVMPYIGCTQYETQPTVSVASYNFTQYGVEYLIPGRLVGSAEAGVANGHGVSFFAYAPGEPGTPVSISWRYVTGEYQGKHEADSQDYMYTATLPEPERTASDRTLMIRFYPDGKVALRYAEKPDFSASENVSPVLSGVDWVVNQ